MHVSPWQLTNRLVRQTPELRSLTLIQQGAASALPPSFQIRRDKCSHPYAWVRSPVIQPIYRCHLAVAMLFLGQCHWGDSSLLAPTVAPTRKPVVASPVASQLAFIIPPHLALANKHFTYLCSKRGEPLFKSTPLICKAYEWSVHEMI